MRISGIQADSFGAWSNLQLEDLSLEVTVFYGPNEAGKSTLLQFIRTILYGFDSPDAKRYLPPANGRRGGGELTVMAPNGRFLIKRRAAERRRSKRKKDGHIPEDELTVSSLDGSMKGAHLLESLLSGIDQSIFNNVFAVGLSELQQLATLSDTAASQLLYGLASGTDRVSLFEVASEVRTARERLLKTDLDGGEDGEIQRLLDERDQLRQQLSEARSSVQRWNSLMEQSSSIDHEIKQLERVLGKSSTDPNANVATLADRWSRCKDVHRKLRQLGPVGDIPADTVTKLQELDSKIAERKRKWEVLTDQQEQLGFQSSRKKNQPWLTSDVKSILHRRDEIIDKEKEINRLETEADETEFEIQSEMERLGISTESHSTLPSIGPEALAKLRKPAREATAARKRLESVKQLVESQSSQTNELQEQLESALTSYGVLDINEAVEQAGNKVTKLRRRIQIDDRLSQLTTHLHDLDSEEKELLRNQVLPWPLLLFFGLLFSSGMLLFGLGLCGTWFGLASANSWLIMLIGMAIGVATLVLKNVIEYSAQSRLEAVDRKGNSVRLQRKKLLEEGAEIEQSLARSSSPLTTRLEEAELELSRLEELMPLHHQRHSLTRDSDSYQGDLQSAQSAYDAARKNWKRLLSRLRLPTNLTPKSVKMLSGNSTSGLQDKLNQIRKRRSKLQQELSSIRSRVYESLIAAEISPGEADLRSQLSLLSKAAGITEQPRTQDRTAKRKFDKLAAEKKKLLIGAKRLKSERRSLAGKFGVFTKKQFEKLLGSSDVVRSLAKERRNLFDQMSSTL